MNDELKQAVEDKDAEEIDRLIKVFEKEEIREHNWNLARARRMREALKYRDGEFRMDMICLFLGKVCSV